MKRYLYLFFLIILIISIFATPLLAQEDVLIEEMGENISNIEADNIFINNKKEEINAVGDVVFSNQELNIKADRLVFDYPNKIITAYGEPLNLIYKGRELEGDRLELDYAKETAYLYQANLEIDKFRFKGAKINYLQREVPNITIDDAYYTTCEMEEAHYHYTAESIEYYPDDKIVGRGIGLWWRNRKLFNLPKYVVNIETNEAGEPEISNSFPVPNLGYNGEQGFFIELLYPYELSLNNYGKVHYIKEDNDNIKFNFIHNYTFSPNKRLYFEYNEEKFTDDDQIVNEEEFMKLGFNHTVNDNVDYRIYFKEDKKKQPKNEAEQKRLVNLDLTYSNDYYSVNTVLGYDFKDDSRSETISMDYKNNNLRINTHNEFSNEKLIKQKYVISQGYDKYNLQLKYLRGYSTDYLPYGSVNYKVKPDLNLSLGYGKIRESDFEQHKIDYGLNYAANFLINRRFDIDFIQDIDHIEYMEADSSVTNYNSEIYLNMNKRIFDSFTLRQRLGYSTKYRDGIPLFDIDHISTDKVIVSNTELDLYYPEQKEHWKLGLDLKYSIPDQEFDKQVIAVTHEYDCYSYQINYDYKNQEVGFEFSFIN
ncbi:MAG: LptA/OstA family protein [Halanaerobiales bacterium]